MVEALPPKGRLEECIELSLKFLSSPWKIYENGCYAMRQIVLRLTLAEPLLYGRIEGCGTPEISFPFKVLGGISGQESKLVPPERFELPTFSLQNCCTTAVL